MILVQFMVTSWLGKYLKLVYNNIMYRNECVFHRILKTRLPTSRNVSLQYIFIHGVINTLLYQVIFYNFLISNTKPIVNYLQPL